MILKGLVVVSYVAMLVMNTLANTLPLGGRTTGDVSAQYPSLFTPVGLTFSIWGLIYLVLGVGVVFYVFGLYDVTSEVMTLFAWVFIVSSVLNVLWLVAWHYDYIVLSTVVMVVLFGVLLVGFLFIPSSYIWFKVPFSLYFAWICVALIANVTIMFVAIDMPRLGLSDATWTVIVLIIAGAIGLATIYLRSDVVFGLVFMWAFYGILTRHISQTGEGLNMAYPQVVSVAGVLLLALIAMNIYVYIMNQMQVFEG